MNIKRVNGGFPAIIQNRFFKTAGAIIPFKRILNATLFVSSEIDGKFSHEEQEVLNLDQERELSSLPKIRFVIITSVVRRNVKSERAGSSKVG